MATTSYDRLRAQNQMLKAALALQADRDNELLKAALALALEDPALPSNSTEGAIVKALVTGGALVGGVDPDTKGIDITEKVRAARKTRVQKDAARKGPEHDLTERIRKSKAPVDPDWERKQALRRELGL